MFILLTNTYGKRVLINFNLVTMVCSADCGANVCFEGDDYIVVQESLEDIYDRIQTAGRTNRK